MNGSPRKEVQTSLVQLVEYIKHSVINYTQKRSHLDLSYGSRASDIDLIEDIRCYFAQKDFIHE